MQKKPRFSTSVQHPDRSEKIDMLKRFMVARGVQRCCPLMTILTVDQSTPPYLDSQASLHGLYVSEVNIIWSVFSPL